MLLALLERPSRSFTDAMRFAFSKTGRVMTLAMRMTVTVLAWLLPFVAVSGLWYFLLLTEFDINYYLQQTPPAFWYAAVLIGVTLLIPIVVVVRRIVSWIVAVPLLLFSDCSPKEVLSSSRVVTAGHRWTLSKAVVGWFLLQTLARLLAFATIGALSGWMLGWAGDKLAVLLFLAVGTLVTVSVVQEVIKALASVLLSLLVWNSYVNLRGQQNPDLSLQDRAQERSPRLATLPWLAVGSAACAIAGGVVWFVIGSVPVEDRAIIVAHRGYSSVAPENTLAAMQKAIDARADFVELDVQESGDDQIVVIHDRDLKKVANVDLIVSESSAAELRQHDIGSHFSTEFSGERIPTLEEVLELCRGKIKVNIELKTYGKDRVLVDRVIQIVEAQQMEDQIVIMSLEPELVARARVARPTWKVGQLIAVAAGDITRIDASFLAIQQSLANPAMVSSAHRKHREVLVWTVNEPIEMSAMLTAGVDGLITDFPELAREVLQERAQLNLLERWLLAVASELENVVSVPSPAASRPALPE